MNCSFLSHKTFIVANVWSSYENISKAPFKRMVCLFLWDPDKMLSLSRTQLGCCFSNVDGMLC